MEVGQHWPMLSSHLAKVLGSTATTMTNARIKKKEKIEDIIALLDMSLLFSLKVVQ